jgi:hypothetical protein
MDTLAPQPADQIVAPAWPVTDAKTIAALYNGRYYYSGITYGQNEPHVADGPIVVNGTPVT